MRIAIAGCTGRMGQTLVRVVRAAPGCTLALGSIRAGEEAAAKELGIAFTYTAKELVESADAVIDFTAPAATCEIARAAATTGAVHVIGTTGISEAQQREIAAAASGARLVQSANYSLGVNVLAALVAQAGALLDAHYDIEVDEMHHRLKKDSPSGTALLLADAAAAGRKIALADARRHYGEGLIGEREHGTIGLSARRGGEVVGVHTVTFAGPGETLELTHRAQSRDIYAHGALKAALWARNKKPGLYSMQDVLGL